MIKDEQIKLSIEKYIYKLFEKENTNTIKITRKEVANYFGCANSLVTYVLNTTFIPKNGYYIQSKKGVGGYIRITKSVSNIIESNNIVKDRMTLSEIEDVLDYLIEKNKIDKNHRLWIIGFLDNKALISIDRKMRAKVRADIFKNFLSAYMMVNNNGEEE